MRLWNRLFGDRPRFRFVYADNAAPAALARDAGDEICARRFRVSRRSGGRLILITRSGLVVRAEQSQGRPHGDPDLLIQVVFGPSAQPDRLAAELADVEFGAAAG